MNRVDICPLCKKENSCGNLKSDVSVNSQQCWCMNEKIDPELLKQLPLSAQGKACICRACALSYKASVSSNNRAEGETP